MTYRQYVHPHRFAGSQEYICDPSRVSCHLDARIFILFSDILTKTQVKIQVIPRYFEDQECKGAVPVTLEQVLLTASNTGCVMR